MKILIADDELLSLRIVEKVLTQWGFQVVRASNGTEAWEILQAHPEIQVAILDWMMPGLDGLEITQRLRKEYAGSRIWIMLLSARTEESYIEKAYMAGVDDYFPKPLNAFQLHQRLRVAERRLAIRDR